jgi:hypothetical protein
MNIFAKIGLAITVLLICAGITSCVLFYPWNAVEDSCTTQREGLRTEVTCRRVYAPLVQR